jgi:hypothetical protein
MMKSKGAYSRTATYRVRIDRSISADEMKLAGGTYEVEAVNEVQAVSKAIKQAAQGMPAQSYSAGLYLPMITVLRLED